MQANWTRLVTPWPRNLYLPTAMPTSVPRTVAPTVATAATSIECSIAVVRSGIANSFEPQYLRVNPVHE